MVNRERFMLDVDSEGFPQRYDDVPHPPADLAGLNVGRSADHAVVQALLADHKCLRCVTIPNLPLTSDEQAFIDLHEHLHEMVAARQLVREADQRMNGVARLSDSAAPDAYFGWKS